MGLYDGEAWAALAVKAGFIPEDTETQAREAFRFAAEEIAKVKAVLQKSADHHEYCGWGDSWERECAEPLMKEIAEMLTC